MKIRPGSGYAATTLILALTAGALAGCAAPAVVRPGDKVELDFTCRLANGALAVTTHSDAQVAGEAKSGLYLPRSSDRPIEVVAGPFKGSEAAAGRMPFEQEVIGRLAPLLPGLKEGERVTRDLATEPLPARSPTERQVVMSTVRTRQKEQRLNREQLKNQLGREPEVGQPFPGNDPLIVATVAEVGEQEVLIRFRPADDLARALPFGPVTVRELGDRYEFDIAAEQGRLIRGGAMAGRIVAVDREKGLMTLDFGHPFGGEKLNCTMEVDSIRESAPVVSAPLPAAPSAEEAAARDALTRELLRDAGQYQESHPLPGTTGRTDGNSQK